MVMAEDIRTHTDESQVLMLPVDPEPTSLRVILLAILFGGVVAGYFITNAIFSIQTCSILGVLGGLAVGVVSIQLAERFLKPRWKSNRYLRATYSAVEILKDDVVCTKIDLAQEAEVHLWYFEIPRRHRVPKGWFVVSIALEQNNIFLPVFTLASPQYFEELPLGRHFTKLTSRKDMDRAAQGSLRVAGQQRRLIKAETARNLDGVEMLNPDFKTYLNWLIRYFPEWMPSS